ncbi:MAG: proteasome assembly chaperone family protein [Halobacteriales archaeon]
MNEVEVDTVTDTALSDPVLVEGLPGVGHVGKLAAEHLIEEFDSWLVRRVHSEHLPPQVGIDEDGVAELACVEVHAVEADRDLLVLVGDHQAADTVGHYRLTETFLDIASAFGVSDIVTMGGVPTGELIEEYGVVGAATDVELADELGAIGVEFPENEPEGGIVGTSGLLLGLGARRDARAACLMGRTSGYLVDPKSARAVLEILEAHLGIDVDFASLEDRADEMEDAVAEMQETRSGTSIADGDENLRYFG